MVKQTRSNGPPRKPSKKDPAGEIILILDKMEQILQAVSKIRDDGSYESVSADEKHRNSFLKVDKHSSMVENFFKNLWSQLRDPTNFRLFKLKDLELDKPQNKQALEDLAAGKQTEAVTEFLKKYEIRPKKQAKEMAKKANEEPQMAPVPYPTIPAQPEYRFNESMINWEALAQAGFTRDYFERRGILDQLLRGYKTDNLQPVNINYGMLVITGDARLSLGYTPEGIKVFLDYLHKAPDLERPYFSHVFSREDKANLLDTGNLGRIVELKMPDGSYVPSYVSIDKVTNQLSHLDVEKVSIPREIKGVKLTEREISDLKEGKMIYVEGLLENTVKLTQ